MLDLNAYLSEHNYTLLRRLNNKEGAQVVLLRRTNGMEFVCRIYDHEVKGYKAAEKLIIPEIPRVYCCTPRNDGMVVEEEYVDGISLAELLQCYFPDERQTASIVLHICTALDALHKHGVIHRDVKPENVLVTQTGRVVLIDLDAASDSDPEKQRDTQLLGTVGYAAPEQFGFGRSDVRTDIFCLGVMMSVMLTGAHPSRKLPEGRLRPVVEKCIEINADKRYNSVAELVEQLREIGGTDEVCCECGFTSPGGGCIFCGVPNGEKVSASPKRSRLVALWSAILFCVVAAFFLFAEPGEAHEEAEPSDAQLGNTVSADEGLQVSSPTPSPSPSPISAVAANPDGEEQPLYVVPDMETVLRIGAGNYQMFSLALDAEGTDTTDESYSYSCDEALGYVYWDKTKNSLCWDAYETLPGASGTIYIQSPEGETYTLAAEVRINEYDSECTDGTPVGDAIAVQFTTEFKHDDLVIHDLTAQWLNNGHARFRVEYTVPAGGRLVVFGPPDGEELRQRFPHTTSGGREAVYFDVPSHYLRNYKFFACSFYGYPGDGDKGNYLFIECDDVERTAP